ncbi:MAG: LegC family aminotransferase [Candidatus Cloacimonetes bacterium]|nr:LegC family aminotransferase [Candidatus Cloacimonadota bacterium]
MKPELLVDFIRELYASTEFIPLHEPFFGDGENKYVNDCLASRFVSSVGKYVDLFEERICAYTGATSAVATVNGTAALHIALLLAGTGPGDLVITQPLTFVATCNAISYLGAQPVFVDIDQKTLGMSPDALQLWLEENVDVVVDKSATSSESQFKAVHKQTGKRVAACVPMHSFGHPCQIDKIISICDTYGIPVVEDSAESLGSYYKGQHTGTFGKLGILSFNGNKTITTGGGGMILTNDEHLGKLAKHITTTAKKPHPWDYEHDMVAYNYRMPNINAALGCGQMELLDGFLEDKRETASRYRDFFAKQNGHCFVDEPRDGKSNFWLNAVLASSPEDRDLLLKVTNGAGVMTRPAWILMNRLEMFKDSACGDLSNASHIASRLVNLPSSVRNT